MKQRVQQKGVAIIVVLLVLSLVAVLAGAIAGIGSGNLVRLKADGRSLTAQYAAESGLWAGVVEVADNGTTGQLFGGPEAMPNGSANYDVFVTQGPGTVNGVTVPDSNHYYIESTGATADYDPLERRVGAMIEIGASSGLDVAVFAETSILLDNGGSTDTYDSRIGPYLISAGSGAGNAHIGTNAGAAGITIQNGGNVDGGLADVYLGPAGGTPAGQGTSYNNAITMSQTKTLDPVSAPALAPGINPGTIGGTHTLVPGFDYGDVVVDGGILTLLPGDYVFSKLEIKNGGQVVVSPAPGLTVNSYVTTDLIIDNGAIGVVNTTQVPERCRFFATPGAGVKLSNGSDQASFVCYAPGSDVLVDNGAQIYGAVVGDNVEIKNTGSAVHFDMALQGVDIFGGGGGGGTSGVNVKLFQRF